MSRQEFWIESKEGNPRNSEGAFATLRDGRIMFAYSRYKGRDWKDDADADLAVCCSSDNGRTWSGSGILLANRVEGGNVMSVSLLRLQDGGLGMVYLQKEPGGDRECTRCHPVFRRSADDGRTWSEGIRPCSNGLVCVNNDRLVQLGSGRIVVPCALGANLVAPDGLGCRPRYSYVAYSDDGGRTWFESPWNIYAPINSRTGLQEPGVVELRNRTLLLWGRTDLGCQYQCFSMDSGGSWSEALPNRDFSCTVTPLSIKRDPVDGRLVAVWADANPRWGIAPVPCNSWDRTPLAMAFSDDEGRTWRGHRLLEDDPRRGFCYVAIHFTRDAVLLGYCCGGHGKECLQDLKIVRLSRDELHA